MGLKTAFRGKAETFAISYVIHGIEAGRYGEKTKAAWLSFKGKKTLIGFVLAAIGGALATFPDPALQGFGAGVGIAGTYLFRFGLVAKGNDKTPPAAFPEEYRSAAVAALSGITYLVEILTGLGGLLLLFGTEGLQNASMTVIMVSQALSTATGYFSTLIGPTPTQAAATAVAAAVAAVESAKVTVTEARADVAAAVDSAAAVSEKAAEPLRRESDS